MLQLKARAKKPIVGTWWASENVDQNYHQRSPAHAKLTFMQTLAYGAAVQPHIQSVFGFETSLVPTLTELFSSIERVRDYMMDADLLPYIAVLDGPGATAYCNALLEHHLPFDLITAEQVNQKRLSAYRAVIVGNGGGLREQGLAELAAYVKAGGGLMCAGQVGESLAALAGVSLEGQVNSGRSELPFYYRFASDDPLWHDLRGRLLSFRHSCAKVTPAADCHIEALIIGLDSGRLDKDHMTIKPYPGPALGPMVVTRRVGAGRVLYLAGDLASIAAPGYRRRCGCAGGIGQSRTLDGGWPAPHHHERSALSRAGYVRETRPHGHLRYERNDEPVRKNQRDPLRSSPAGHRNQGEDRCAGAQRDGCDRPTREVRRP